MYSQIRNYAFLVPIFLQLTYKPLLCALFWVAGSSFLKGDDFYDTNTTDMLKLTEYLDASIYAGWESHYFSEGRDNLDGGSLIVNDVQLGWKFFYAELWYVASPDQSYDELQAILAVTQTIENVEFYLNYTHLQFPSDNQKDNETGAGLVISDLPLNLQLAANVYYSFAAKGSFAEISAARTFAVTESLNIVGCGIFGMNQNYISDGHDGANHFALRLESTYTASDSISIVAQITQSWEIDRDSSSPGDEPLVDLFYGSVGVQWSL